MLSGIMWLITTKHSGNLIRCIWQAGTFHYPTHYTTCVEEFMFLRKSSPLTTEQHWNSPLIWITVTDNGVLKQHLKLKATRSVQTPVTLAVSHKKCLDNIFVCLNARNVLFHFVMSPSSNLTDLNFSFLYKRLISLDDKVNAVYCTMYVCIWY